ncbi:MAG: PASTA domain-containing protein, partial [Rikenellaceae bacterium]
LTGQVERDIMRYLYNRDGEWLERVDTTSTQYTPKRVKGGSTRSIGEVTDQLLDHKLKSSKGEEWARVEVDSSSSFVLKPITQSKDIVPNVVGMGLKDALFLLESRGLRVTFSGHGAVVSQSIPAERKISATSKHIVLKLR